MSTPSSDLEALCLAVFERTGAFNAYSQIYRESAASDDFAVEIQQPTREARSFHSTVLAAITSLKKDPAITLDGLKRAVRENAGDKPDASVEHAINTAVQSLLMVDAKANEWHPPDYVVNGYRPASWLPNEPFHEFVDKQFPTAPASERVITALEERHKLKAWKLHSRHGIQLQPTENLAKHLVYDSRHRCVWFFHHSSFLKGHLEKFRDDAEPFELGVEESLKRSVIAQVLRGSLPPQLLLETLHSLRTVLFSPVDTKSDKLLKNLVSENPNIDRELRQRFDGYIIRRIPAEAFQYKYWGKRMADLHEAVNRKPPRNWLAAWFDRQSTEGNALFIALLALLISIVVGIISIGLAVFQSWVAWMAWKHPVSSSGS